MRSTIPRWFATLLILVVASPVRADWPMARHDPKRSATASDAPAGIVHPAPYWRYYLGGTLTAHAYLVADVNKDSRVEVVYVAGGKVIAKLQDDSTVWESPAREVSTLVGVDDLDGDGVLDVVAHSSRQAFVFSGKTGAVEWAEPDGEMGTISKVLLGDLDGDQLPDLYIQECGCCGVNSHSPGVAYRFKGGYQTSAPFWIAPAHGGCNGSSNALGDFDADGKLDLAFTDRDKGLYLVKGTDGTELGLSQPTGERMDAAVCDVANLDGRPGDEVICFVNIYQAASSQGNHRVWVATYDTSASPKVRILWQHAMADKVKGSLTWVGSSLSDLDGDGKHEIVVAETEDSSQWATRIYRAVDGTVLAEAPGQLIRQILDLDGDGKGELLTAAPSGGALTAWKFDPQASPALSQLWTLAGGLSVRDQVDWTKTRRSSLDSRPLALDLDGDKVLEPVFLGPAPSGGLVALTGYKANAKATPTALRSYAIPEGTSVLTQGVFSSVNRPYDQLIVVRSDGFLAILDKELKPTNQSLDSEFPEPGMRVGGYYSGAYGLGTVPIAPRGTAAADAVVGSDSRGSLLWLEPQGASLVSPPKPAWQVAGAAYPALVEKLDSGKPGLICRRSGSTVAAYTLGGKPIWSQAAGGAIMTDPLPGQVDGDGIPDIFIAYSSAGSVANAQVLGGANGKPLWAVPFSEPLDWGFQPFAVSDFNGDGKADLWVTLNRMKVLGGPDGKLLAEHATFLAYFLPALADLDGDGQEEVALSGGYYPPRVLKHDLSAAVWVGKDDDRPYPFGARAVCSPSRSVWVQPSLQTPGLVRLITMNGTDAGKASAVVLAGGQLFADAASARAAGKFLGTVGNVTIKPNLLGPSSHPSALVGSTDGWLYALDPCAGTLDWSHDFRFPVGEPILADTSGDGVDELVVTVADGYLYGLAQQLVAAPTFVFDTDPPHGITDRDVDTISTFRSLYGSWGAVSGADSYEVAVLTPGGTYVTQPNWRNVGASTSAQVDGLSLVDGKKYIFAVRAVSTSKGASAVVSSNGVVVSFLPSSPDAGPHPGADGGPAEAGVRPAEFAGGCSCSVPEQGALDLLWVFAAAALALAFVLRGRRAPL